MQTTKKTLTTEEQIALLEREIEKLSGDPQYVDVIQSLQEEIWMLEFGG